MTGRRRAKTSVCFGLFNITPNCRSLGCSGRSRRTQTRIVSLNPDGILVGRAWRSEPDAIVSVCPRAFIRDRQSRQLLRIHIVLFPCGGRRIDPTAVCTRAPEGPQMWSFLCGMEGRRQRGKVRIGPLHRVSGLFSTSLMCK